MLSEGREPEEVSLGTVLSNFWEPEGISADCACVCSGFFETELCSSEPEDLFADRSVDASVVTGLDGIEPEGIGWSCQ